MPLPAFRAARIKQELSEPLPDPFPTLARAGIRFRRAQVHMISGPPQAGKSPLAQTLLHKMDVGGLYMSADTDQVTMLDREVAIWTGHDLDSIERVRKAGMFEVEYADILYESKISYAFDRRPKLTDLWMEIEAYGEMYGEYPPVLVIDNAMNMVPTGDGEWSALMDLLRDLNDLSEKCGSSIWALHHMRRVDGHPTGTPSPIGHLSGKVDQIPSLVLSVANNGHMMGVCAVKNRHGPADPNAEYPLLLRSDFARMQLTEKEWTPTSALDGSKW